MNFEFKSTFKRLITPVSLRYNRSTCSGGILFVNLASLLLVVWLYLENSIIPATYGSGPSAATWIMAFKVSAIGWMISTLFAIVHLIYVRFHRKPVFIFLKNGSAHRLTVLKRTVRVQLIQFLLVIHLLKNLERWYTQHHVMRRYLLFNDRFIYHQNILLTN